MLRAAVRTVTPAHRSRKHTATCRAGCPGQAAVCLSTGEGLPCTGRCLPLLGGVGVGSRQKAEIAGYV